MPDLRDFDAHVAAHVPLAVSTRGGMAESVHYGSIAVVDGNGKLILAAGDPAAQVFTRSALKPLQALPFVRDDGPARFGYSDAQLALLCASHSGEPVHVNAVAGMLAAAGNAPGDLGCGTHAPLHFEARGEVPPRPPWSPLAHNCSGKHAGMLAACSLHGWQKAGYLAADHPVQQDIRAAVARFAGVAAAELRVGIDGCSAPNYALPLIALARAYARLARAGDGNHDLGMAPLRLRDAMLAHPAMVSGQGRSDLALARAGRGDWLAKTGAEGMQAIGVVSRGWGIAIKIADGSRRAIIPLAVAVLKALGLVDQRQQDELAHMTEPRLVNLAGAATGTVRPLVQLRRC